MRFANDADNEASKSYYKEFSMFLNKKVLILALSTTLFCSNANAININDVLGGAINSALSSLDSKFDNLFSNSINFVNACFSTDFKLGVDATDVCALASKLDNIKFNVCKPFGGNYNMGLSGFQRLCNAKQKEFNDYVSKSVVNFAEWAILQNDKADTNFMAKLPNGMDLNTFNKTWDINNVLKDDSATNVVSNYLRNGKMKEIELLMDYSKSYGSKINPSDIRIEDVKAPQDLNAYKQGIDESIKNHRAILKSANPTQSATLARSRLLKEPKADMKELTNQFKSEYDNAKIAEIGNTLAINDYKKIAIPTQEYVNSLRSDLKLSAIAQIRKQQATEVALITQIEEKWEKKYNLAKLLVDKESILAQKFDEASAKQEIEKIANGF